MLKPGRGLLNGYRRGLQQARKQADAQFCLFWHLCLTMLHVYNSLTRSKQLFEPIEPGKVRMYVCGITVYDYCHIGHARMFTVFDMVQRWIRASGYELTYVRNITDIEDKIIKRAVEQGVSIR